MKPPGKTTLSRMSRAAQLEAERIEISQDARVLAEQLDEPMPDQVDLRDDFAGIVRLIDAINSDVRLKDTVLDRMQRMTEARAKPAPAAPIDETAEIEVDAE